MASRAEAFRLLGITPNATEAEVRAAFRRKVFQQHPDTAAHGTDESNVRRLIDAYHLLIDPERRPGADTQVTRRHSPDPFGPRTDVNLTATENRQSSSAPDRWCQECMATGVRFRLIRCPTCRGSSVVTTLDIERVRVSPCPRCRGQGLVRSVEQCQACKGTGAARP